MNSTMITSFYVTFPNLHIAKDVSRILLEEKWIACANIIPGVVSIYDWEGDSKEDEEVLVFFKTYPDLAERVEARIKELHPFECPCILQMDMKANFEYLQWVKLKASALIQSKPKT